MVIRKPIRLAYITDLHDRTDSQERSFVFFLSSIDGRDCEGRLYKGLGWGIADGAKGCNPLQLKASGLVATTRGVLLGGNQLASAPATDQTLLSIFGLFRPNGKHPKKPQKASSVLQGVFFANVWKGLD